MKIVKYRYISGEKSKSIGKLPEGSQVLMMDKNDEREWSSTWSDGEPNDEREWSSTWSDGEPVAGRATEGCDDKIVLRIPVPNVEPMDVLVTKQNSYLVVQERDKLKAFALGKTTKARVDVVVSVVGGKLYAGSEEVIEVRAYQGSLMRIMDIDCLTETALKENSTSTHVFKRQVEVGNCTAVIEGDKFKVSKHEASGTLEDVERALEAISLSGTPEKIEEGDILKLEGDHEWAFVQRAPSTVRYASALIAIYCKVGPDGSCVGGDGWDKISHGRLASQSNFVVNIHRDPETFFWFIGNLNGSPAKYAAVRRGMPDFCGFVATACEGGVKVGCQTITKAQLEELAAALKESKNDN